jgi:hypothetical protein
MDGKMLCLEECGQLSRLHVLLDEQRSGKRSCLAEFRCFARTFTQLISAISVDDGGRIVKFGTTLRG